MCFAFKTSHTSRYLSFRIDTQDCILEETHLETNLKRLAENLKIQTHLDSLQTIRQSHELLIDGFRIGDIEQMEHSRIVVPVSIPGHQVSEKISLPNEKYRLSEAGLPLPVTAQGKEKHAQNKSGKFSPIHKFLLILTILLLYYAGLFLCQYHNKSTDSSIIEYTH